MNDQLWQACMAQLISQIPEQQYNTWLKPLEPATIANDLSNATLTVANRFQLDWIRSQYGMLIEKILEEISGKPVRLDIVLAQRLKPKGIQRQQIDTFDQQTHQKVIPAPMHIAENNEQYIVDRTEQSRQTSRLNPTLTFENLVPGRANQMARAAALYVAQAPGTLYNPLFVYGGVGLGKTHLMHAVGNQMLADNPNAQALYIHAEQFVSDVVKSYQRRTFDEFKARYHNLDLLLIDDVQFFSGKERTQEEFFNAFEALLTKKAHIILTSDTYPKGMSNIDERLTSRFDSGLTVALEPPELEMRVAILLKKAINEGTELSEDVAFFIAKNVRSNVRELEGALRKVLAYSRFNQKEISIQLAREALKDLLSIQNRQISVENIQKTVADFYKIKVADMYSKRRPAAIAKPRQIAMYLAKELTQKSLPEIGELFGGRDHTTVLHAVRKITSERQQMPELNKQLHVLEQTLKG